MEGAGIFIVLKHPMHLAHPLSFRAPECEASQGETTAGV